ncbi:MAG: hypothetical protein JHC31_05690 [Sulfurihydrogenibium sp.]|nr:hypothetical protein [Sulfurihydrogenibium sp.]
MVQSNWYCERISEELERLQYCIQEVKDEYKEQKAKESQDELQEPSEGEVLVEAICRALDLESFDSKNAQKILKGLGMVLDSIGTKESIRLSAIFTYIASSNFYLEDVKDYLRNTGFID